MLGVYADTDFKGLGAKMDALTIPSAGFKVREEKGNRAKVDFDNYVLQVDDQGQSVSVTLRPGCVGVELADQPEGTYCFDGIPIVKELGLSNMALIAVKEGDSWFVSPSHTLVDAAMQIGQSVVKLFEDDKMSDEKWIEAQLEEFKTWAENDPLIGPMMSADGLNDLLGGALPGAAEPMFPSDEYDDYDFGDDENPLPSASANVPEPGETTTAESTDTYEEDAEKMRNAEAISDAELKTVLNELMVDVKAFANANPGESISVDGGFAEISLTTGSGAALTLTPDPRVLYGYAYLPAVNGELSQYCVGVRGMALETDVEVGIDETGALFDNMSCQ